MAPNADAMCRGLAEYLASALGCPVELVENVPWSERERQFDAGEIDLCWICGLPYVEKADRSDDVALCVAPVMKASRYRGLPVYFSDVLVHAESGHSSFADLRGAAWAYNEPRSHSGHSIVRYHLATLGQTFDYFGSLVEAGTHQAALRMIASRRVAAAAIDSTVLEAELGRDPSLLQSVRAIATLGPSPAPPWVFSASTPRDLRAKVTRCLAGMHRTPGGAAVLARWGIVELRAVNDAEYDPIRRMTCTATAPCAGSAAISEPLEAPE